MDLLIMKYGLAFLLAALCLALGIFVLALVPIGLVAILHESGVLTKADIDRILRKFRLKAGA